MNQTSIEKTELGSPPDISSLTVENKQTILSEIVNDRENFTSLLYPEDRQAVMAGDNYEFIDKATVALINQVIGEEDLEDFFNQDFVEQMHKLMQLNLTERSDQEINEDMHQWAEMIDRRRESGGYGSVGAGFIRLFESYLEWEAKTEEERNLARKELEDFMEKRDLVFERVGSKLKE
jgi:hypothetical protein